MNVHDQINHLLGKITMITNEQEVVGKREEIQKIKTKIESLWQ